MKMPDRPGGAGGSLVRANLFDTEDTPPFSRTRHGANVIHKRNGDLLVTRDAPADTVPPWLLARYSYDMALTRPFDELLHRFGLDDEDRVDQSGPSPSNIDPFGLIYVGDGFLLESYRKRSPGTLHLRLRNLDDVELSGAVDLGVTIGQILPSLGYVQGISLCATGWRDAEHGYGFAAYYFDTSIAKYVCLSGCTRKPLDWMTVPMPGEPADWWTPATMQGQLSASVDAGYGKCYAVGRGHLLALLLPIEDIEVGSAGGVPQFAPRVGILPPSAAPQLLRSRDFGQTWELEDAPYLAVAGTYDALADVSTPGGATYPVAVRYCPWMSNFYACPIGGGRIAMAAGAPTTSGLMEFDPTQWYLSVRRQTLAFHVSDPSGTNFVRRAWPLDGGRNAFPVALGAPTAGTSTIVSPLFGFGATNPNALGTLGPGTFFALAEQVTRTNPGFVYGPYPSAMPVLVYVTRDYGATWAAEQIPAAALPFASTFYENKAGWESIGEPIISGDGTQVSDSWLSGYIGVCVTSPSNAAGLGGDVAFVTGEMTGPLQLAITSGAQTFGSIERGVTLERGGLWTPKPGTVTGIPLPIYTGDPDSLDYPEAVRLGYPEFEDRT
ncbi:hypothetical protein [Acidovorax sp. BL-A-41-H1]|uniref:hypothetical protein n=1 Tax=Acidovorax sp. BL-A-41-H1 TaxID=3421102 RepID=UPI003F7B095B